MKIHCLQHVPFEGLGSIEAWIKKKGHPLSFTRLFDHEIYPQVDDLDCLIIMGGPMGIYDEDKYPWLESEKTFIEKAIQEDKIIIGICLGAQLIAGVLGAKVYKGPHKEIGWFPVNLSAMAGKSKFFDFFPPRLTVFHWHGDTFEVPEGATHIASSEGCVNQAFVFNEKIFGFQFHLETTKNGVDELLKYCGNDIEKGSFIQSPAKMLADKSRFRTTNRIMDQFMDRIELQQRAHSPQLAAGSSERILK